MLKVRTKIYLIVILMFLTITTLSASTYAWFEMNQFANVNNISMNVTEGADLMISLDGENWKYKIEEEDLYSILFGIELNDVTSLDGINITHNDGRKTNKKNYVQYDIYFKLKDMEAPKNGYSVYLTNYNNYATYEQCKNGTAKGTCIKSLGVNFYNKYEFLYDYIDNTNIIWNDGKYYMCYQEDAIRVSFENNGEATIFDLSKNPNRGYNYTPNSLEPSKQYGAFQYSLACGRDDGLIDNKGPKVTTRTEFTKYSTNTVIPKAHDNNSIVCDLEEVDTKVYVGKTTVRIWLEGWDADCFDSILTDSTMIQFEFTFAEKYLKEE